MPSITKLVQGPAWSPSGLDIRAGRYPLSVEPHVLTLVGKLVPGVTTVTLNARYYCLHALAALEAEKQELSRDAALDLLRRMEVVMGGISVLHEHVGLPRAHGADVIAPHIRDNGSLDVAILSTPARGHYVEAKSGYWGPYIGSELTLGIISGAGSPLPGDRCNESAIRDGLNDLLELARHDVLDESDLLSASKLCICQSAHSSDGAWLRDLLCSSEDASSTVFSKPDRARNATARLLAAVAEFEPTTDLPESFTRHVAFGSFCEQSEIAQTLEEAEVWRGLIFRRFAVGAWRRIWAHLVNDIVVDLIKPEQIADAVANELPNETIQTFMEGLPSTTTDGAPAPAEISLRAGSNNVITSELGVLALSGIRSSELEGAARDAFVGRPIELAPEWIAQQFNQNPLLNLREFGRNLTLDLLERSKRVSMAKMRRMPNGQLLLPTRLLERGDFLYKTSNEGGGDVGLRIAQLGNILTGVGVFDRAEDQWQVTPMGKVALGV